MADTGRNSNSNNRRKSAGRIAKVAGTLLRFFAFVALSLGPLLAITYGNLRLLRSFQIQPTTTDSPLEIIIIALGISLQLMLLFQVFVPLAIQMFIPHHRIRDPKQIIRYGEKFREQKLSTPTFLLIEKAWPWPNILQGLVGFFALPKPFHAIVIMKEEVFESLSQDEFDFWVLRNATLGANSLQGRLIFWILLLTPLTFLFHPGLGALSLVCWMGMWVLREWELDHLMVLSLEGLPSAYWNMIRKTHGAWTLMGIRNTRYFGFSTPFWVKKLHFIPVLLLAATTFLFHQTLQPPGQGTDPGREPGRGTGPQAEVKLEIEAMQLPVFQYIAQAKGFPEELSQLKRLITEAQKELIPGDSTSHAEGDATTSPLDGWVREPKLGATPLLWAAQYSTQQVVYFLLTQGASLEEVDHRGEGILFYGLRNRNSYEMISYLLQGKINLQRRNQEGKTVHDLAVELNNTKVRDLLIGVSIRSGYQD